LTHDELLKKINIYTICIQPTKAGMVCDNQHLKEIYPEWFALRAVVELHKPCDPVSDDKFVTCEICNYEYDREYPYPCETIQAIEKELG